MPYDMLNRVVCLLIFSSSFGFFIDQRWWNVASLHESVEFFGQDLFLAEVIDDCFKCLKRENILHVHFFGKWRLKWACDIGDATQVDYSFIFIWHDLDRYGLEYELHNDSEQIRSQQ